MRGDKKIIEQLNAALSSELTAIVQYMTQSEMCHNWGYVRLGELTKCASVPYKWRASCTISVPSART